MRLSRISVGLRGTIGVKLGVFSWKVESKSRSLMLTRPCGDQQCRRCNNCYHEKYGYCYQNSPRSEENASSPIRHESMELLLAEEIRGLDMMLLTLFGSNNDCRRIDVVGDDLTLLILASILIVYYIACRSHRIYCEYNTENATKEDRILIYCVG